MPGKQFCANPKCKKELIQYRMVLMMGPRGYRRYAVCMGCAGKVDASSARAKIARSAQREGQKAGA